MRSIILSVLLALMVMHLFTGCAHNQPIPVYASAFRDSSKTVTKDDALCFAPVDESIKDVEQRDLLERARRQCIASAIANGIRVAEEKQTGCLETNLQLQVLTEGDPARVCMPVAGSFICRNFPHGTKVLTLRMRNASGVEIYKVRTSAPSARADFSDQALHILCAGAFRHYPDSFQQVQFDAESLNADPALVAPRPIGAVVR